MNHECKDPDECWFWWLGTWIASGDPTPELAPEVIRNELYDFHGLISGMSLFYDEITGGRVTKPNTSKQAIASMVQERIDESYDAGYAMGLIDGKWEARQNCEE